MKTITSSLLAGCMLGASLSAQAAVTYDFTSGGTTSTEIGSGFGNALDFGDMTVTAWGTTGVPTNANSLLDVGQINRFSTGLGACNKSESANCNNPAHQVDNVGDDDLVLFLFDSTVTFNNITIDPYGVYDRDVSFWIANISAADSDLTGLAPASLINGSSAFGSITNVWNSASYLPISIDLGGASGNALLFGGRLDFGSYYDNDRFKIASLDVTPVPVPAAAWLLGSGLLALVGVSRRKIQ